MSITIESILLDRINELSQELAGVKHDLQQATKEVSDLDQDYKNLKMENDIATSTKGEVINHILDLLCEIEETYQRAEKDGCDSFMEDIRETLDEWNITYQYK